MCGRTSTADLSADSLKTHFGLDNTIPFLKSYNVAPTLQMPAIREQDHIRSLCSLRWGLIPHWSNDTKIALHTFNARIETLTQKPSFRESIKSKRCIVPASGFYEWQKLEQVKQPYYIYRADKQPIAFAGLWDKWVDKESGETVESCSIVTMPATSLMAEIHDRMPAILEPEHFDVWLDPEFKEPHVLLDILKAEELALKIYPVSSYVSNSRNDGKKCIERMD
jgi:putative SOS response-associated peptidase YedK